jgi:hypothetical protein
MFNFTSIATLAGLVLACLLHGGKEWTWDFAGDAVGARPAGFYFDTTRDKTPGRWEVLDDQGDHVLAQLDEKAEKWRFALAIVEDSWMKDLKLSVRIKAIRGTVDQSGGVVWRYRNSENYLLARLDAADGDVRLFRVRDGNSTPFGIKEDLDLKTDQWYTLRVEHRGREVKVYLDDDILLIEHDKHFHRPGRIGLWTKADAVTCFDDLKAKNLNDDD